MDRIKKALGILRKYHVWSDQTGTGDVLWLTRKRAQNLAACGWWTVTEVR